MNKPAEIALLYLQDEIVRAAGDAFDRQHYDEFWQQWSALQEHENAS